MENNGKSKTVTIIILIVVILGLGGYIGYSKLVEEPKKESDNKKTVQKLEMKVNDKTKYDKNKVAYTYKDLVGVYTFEGNKTGEDADIFRLQLEENGLFHYQIYRMVETGIVGYYTIDGNKITLNYLYEHGSDAALTVTKGTDTLTVVSKTEITDETIDKDKLSLEGSYDKVTLKKSNQESYKTIYDFENIEIFNNKRSK